MRNKGRQLKEDAKLVEANISLYKVTPLGGMQRNY